MIFRISSVVSVLFFLYGCVTDIVPATGERRYLGYTWQQETGIGKQASKEVTSLFGVYGDTNLGRYVTEVGNRVLATSHLRRPDRKSTRLNSSHMSISYAVFCLKKKKNKKQTLIT